MNKRYATTTSEQPRQQRARTQQSFSFQDLVQYLATFHPSTLGIWHYITDQTEKVAFFYQLDYLAPIPNTPQRYVRVLQQRTPFMECLLQPTVFIGGEMALAATIPTVLESIEALKTLLDLVAALPERNYVPEMPGQVNAQPAALIQTSQTRPMSVPSVPILPSPAPSDQSQAHLTSQIPTRGIAAPGQSFQIFINCGRTVTLDVKSSDSIAVVKEKLQRKLSVPTALQFLVYGGKPLEDQRTLEDYNIQRESNLQLHYRQAFQHTPPNPLPESESYLDARGLARSGVCLWTGI